MPLTCLLALALLLQDPAPTLTHGPLRGACDSSSMDFWARAHRPGEYRLTLLDQRGMDVFEALMDNPLSVRSVATAENDLTLHWHIGGLKPDTAYFGIVIDSGNGLPLIYERISYRTSVGRDHKTASLIFGSCSDERTRPDQPIWKAIQAAEPDALVLLGDTPYIDSTALAVKRARYRDFLAFEPVREVLRRTPNYFTWDDHDYALNDQFGLVEGRADARRAFLEYHASQQLGVGNEGIFQSFRRGPVEVFLLDTRWFADIEESPLAPGKRSLLGAEQLDWLQQGLAFSTADFKVLACGMVWNNAVRPIKRDCWGNWLDERDGLLRWIGEKKISGVVLVGGDIHRSRVILHPVKALAGYDVPEFISSPMAQSVIEAAKVDAPGLLFDVGAPASFLSVEARRTADGPLICGRIMDGAGKELFVQAFRLADLSETAAK